VGFEDVVGRLKAYEERIRDDEPDNDQGKLLFNESESSNRRDSSKNGRGRGLGRGGQHKNPSQQNLPTNTTKNDSDKSKGKSKDRSNVQCYRCDKYGHFASQCPDRIQKLQELNLNKTEDDDESVFLHETVFLNEEKVIPAQYDYRESNVWYLGNGASNHMIGTRSFFLELNERITGRVNFGDNSCVDIKGKGSILFQGKGGQSY